MAEIGYNILRQKIVLREPGSAQFRKIQNKFAGKPADGCNLPGKGRVIEGVKRP
jgi:hypothetical protein